MKSSCSVLVVEDDYPMRKVLDRQLTSLGCKVDLACNGHEGLSLWERNSYDLVLSDFSMPGMSGAELASKIRGSTRQGAREVPLIAITGHRDDPGRRSMGEFSACLHKPFALPELERIIRRWWPVSGRAAGNTAVPGLDPNLSGDDMRIITRVFIDTVPEYVHALESACDTGSPSRIADTSHKLKSAARLVGGHGVADLCEALEEACHNTEMTVLARMSASVCDAALTLATHLQAALAAPDNANE